jgi:hypothetical protein
MSRSLRKILLIRHAEKPVPDLGIGGVDEQGAADKRSLSVRGWQRAGALVRFFAPLHDAFAHRLIERPDALFAASPRSRSLRPVQTLGDLSLHLKLPIRQEFDSQEDERALIDAMNNGAGVALVSWRNDAMAMLARLLVDDAEAIPAWDKARFDLVWVLARTRGRWSFDQVPQLLLPGDRTEPITASVDLAA